MKSLLSFDLAVFCVHVAIQHLSHGHNYQISCQMLNPRRDRKNSCNSLPLYPDGHVQNHLLTGEAVLWHFEEFYPRLSA